MFLFSTDIDGTVYDGAETAAAFASYWAGLAERFSVPPTLAYNTGRSLDDTRELIEKAGLPAPDWFICGVGTLIFHPSTARELQPWNDHLADGWKFDQVHKLVGDENATTAQPDECQGDFKSSWFWSDATKGEIEKLQNDIRAIGIDAQAIYSSKRDLDVLPTRANKGNAVVFLAKRLGLPLNRVIVAGDSGNDAAMYHTGGAFGIVVKNAEPALIASLPESAEIFHASKDCAHGVIEGIEHFSAKYFT
jgi:sucrose-6F-phosphate phosphohydrolase